jgi:FkbM family methyltransferase
MLLSKGEEDIHELLPPELLQLGIELLGSEEAVAELVHDSRFEHVDYGGVAMKLRLVNGDLGNATLAQEGKDLYGMDSLETLRDRSPQQQGINMVDLGGNYGAVSIAAYKKYPDQLRVVTVEPIPSTYFFMRWNMWLNEVPTVEESNFQKNGTVGVLALNHGVVAKDREVIEVCYTPPYTMIGQVCSCDSPYQWPGKQCHRVPGITIQGLVDLFGGDPITIAKIDCEGCEIPSLPVLAEMARKDSGRVRRLVGELHFPTPDLEKMACEFDSGQFFVRLCSTAELPADPQPLTCGTEPPACERDSDNALVMEGIEKALDA